MADTEDARRGHARASPGAPIEQSEYRLAYERPLVNLRRPTR